MTDTLLCCCLEVASSDSKGKTIAIAGDASDHSERTFDSTKVDSSVVLSFSPDLISFARVNERLSHISVFENIIGLGTFERISSKLHKQRIISMII